MGAHRGSQDDPATVDKKNPGLKKGLPAQNYNQKNLT